MDDATAALAIYAAIISTGALALEFRRWFESGPRLSIRLMSAAQIIGGWGDDDWSYISVRVANLGDRPTTLTNMALLEFRSIFHRWLRRQSYSAIVIRPEAYGGATLPYVLAPGTEWSGTIRYSHDLKRRALSGHLFVGIYGSHGPRGHVRKVVVPPGALDDLPADEN